MLLKEKRFHWKLTSLVKLYIFQMYLTAIQIGAHKIVEFFLRFVWPPLLHRKYRSVLVLHPSKPNFSWHELFMKYVFKCTLCHVEGALSECQNSANDNPTHKQKICLVSVNLYKIWRCFNLKV